MERAAAMPPYSIPRRPFSSQNQEPIPVNWRRGMIRVWILLSVAWIMGWVIEFIVIGLQGGFKLPGDFLAVPVLLFGPPVALLLFGIAAGWAFRGFRVDGPKSEISDQ
ncbi:MAG TPA: hypothetical protein VGZ49_08245 [Xanthobacteraceae bacterium]|nr:hypothetical protein [Xanthobacteraceae bacterium]